jgi:hypothetical protein
LRGTELEQCPLQLVDPCSRRARDAEDTPDARILDGELRHVAPQVDLVEHDRLRARLETGAVRGKLVVDRREALGRVVLRGVDHVQEEIRALEMGQELVSEAVPFARALDQPGDVRDGELTRRVRRVDGAEHRRQRRERIVGHLRLGVRDA